MRIAMVQSTSYPPEEGIGNYVLNLSHELTNRGHEITVITRGQWRREEFRDDGLQVVRLPCPPVYPFHVDVHGVFLSRYLNQMEDRFDLIHAHTPLVPAVETSLPLVATVHTSVVEDVKYINGWARRLKSGLTASISSKRLVAELTDAADRNTTVSQRVRDEIAEYYGVDDATVVGNGVDPEKFYPAERNDDRYVLFVGRLDYPKGVPDLIEAMETVLEMHDAELVIVGEGPEGNRLKQLAERSDIADHITFTGYVSRDRQIQLYQNATVFAVPSHYEGLPTVLLEGMACGAPTVATAVGGAPEVIEDGVNGRLVPPGEPPTLAEAISTALADPALRERFGENARQTILDRYTWEAITDSFEREYRLAMREERAAGATTGLRQ